MFSLQSFGHCKLMSRWLYIGLVLFLQVYGPRLLKSVSVHKHAKIELDQYPAILTSHLFNNLHVQLLDVPKIYSLICSYMILDYFWTILLLILVNIQENKCYQMELQDEVNCTLIFLIFLTMCPLFSVR